MTFILGLIIGIPIGWITLIVYACYLSIKAADMESRK